MAREPCPNYDGSIEAWEEEEFGKSQSSINTSQNENQDSQSSQDEIDALLNGNNGSLLDKIDTSVDTTAGIHSLSKTFIPNNYKAVLQNGDDPLSERESQNSYRLIFLVLSLVCCCTCICSGIYLSHVIRKRRMANR